MYIPIYMHVYMYKQFGKFTDMDLRRTSQLNLVVFILTFKNK